MYRNFRTQRRHAALAGSSASPIFVSRKLASTCLCLLLMLGAPALLADYLSDLDAEVKKVEARQIDGESGTSTVAAPAELSADDGEPREGTTRDAFEALLKENYLGTFGFYKKLPERSRQEIYIDYRDGAAMSEVRKKIIDRLLQR
jgi:hypothetical protein